MQVEHSDLAPFEPTLRRLLGIAFDPPRVAPKSAELIARFAPSGRARQAVAETLSAYGSADPLLGSAAFPFSRGFPAGKQFPFLTSLTVAHDQSLR